MRIADQVPGWILPPAQPGLQNRFCAVLGKTGHSSPTQQLLPGVGLELHLPF